MINVLFVGLGGFIGASLRYLLTLLPIHYSSFPIMTLIINFIGSFILGFLTEIPFINDNKKLSLLLKTGACGGFTTFSAFSLETFDIFKKKKYITASSYVALSIALCILGVFLGKSVAKRLIKT